MIGFYIIVAVIVILIFVGFSGHFYRIGNYFRSMWRFGEDKDYEDIKDMSWEEWSKTYNRK